MAKVLVLMGSGSDAEHAKKITGVLDDFGVSHEERVASAHKTPEKLLSILKEAKDARVIVAIAGLSNALSGMVAAQTPLPVITCPPYVAEDIMSSLRMPPGVAHETVLDPRNAALACVKILALGDAALRKKLEAYLAGMKGKIEEADAAARRK